VQALGCAGGPGHLGEGDSAGGGLGVCGFSVTQTLAGVLASCPQGIPVLQADAPADPEVRVSQMTVSVRNARCALKYCLIRLAL